jgi:hypothetical protein
LKFALYRLPADLRVLKQIRPLFLSRPDLSHALSAYGSKFKNAPPCQQALYDALSADPVYDAAAGDYVLALDLLVPRSRCAKFKRLVAKLLSRSEEKSLLIRFPTKLFAYKRTKISTMVGKLLKEVRPQAAGLLINRLAIDHHACVTPKQLESPIRKFAGSTDPDLARYCTYLMLTWLRIFPGRAATAGKLLLRHLGVRVQLNRQSLLVGFFKDMFGLSFDLAWERLLGKKAHSESQRRSNVIRGFWYGNPSVFITALDSFNDLLLQRFSGKHPKLTAAFRMAAKPQKVPDFGNWLSNGSLTALLPTCSAVMDECHRLRVEADVAHAVGKKTGRHTRPLSYSEAERMVKKLRPAYRELLKEWRTL